ncbi:hypothetical protein FV139_18670 [Parahaliea maris]|uniref:DUF5648 domain-containing protein n=1 Tax=Parahaliea maris TaxID=2716870 RepID=A0A5C8ZSE1_9GAMM|nr:hypothetical protein [Parahaliea maris]TXS90281.1 hypothetical protein FV139_18670 [Parahaliea maris]
MKKSTQFSGYLFLALVFPFMVNAGDSVPPVQADDLPPGRSADLATLRSYWHKTRIDHFETATTMGQNAALTVFGYVEVRAEARVLKSAQAQTVALDLYWNEELQDNATVATSESVQMLLAAGYEKKATEGFIYQEPFKGTVPLYLFYSEELKDFRTSTLAPKDPALRQANYVLVRIEGYVFPVTATVPAYSDT